MAGYRDYGTDWTNPNNDNLTGKNRPNIQKPGMDWDGIQRSLTRITQTGQKFFEHKFFKRLDQETRQWGRAYQKTGNIIADTLPSGVNLPSDPERVIGDPYSQARSDEAYARRLAQAQQIMPNTMVSPRDLSAQRVGRSSQKVVPEKSPQTATPASTQTPVGETFKKGEGGSPISVKSGVAKGAEYNPRSRYLKMAGQIDKMSLAERNQAVDKAGLIEVIRGNEMTYWSPKYPEREFGSAAEAITGYDKSGEKGDIDIEKARIATQGRIQEAEIAKSATLGAARIRADASIQNAKASGLHGGTWNFDTDPDTGKLIVMNNKMGPSSILPVETNDAQRVAFFILQLKPDAEGLDFGYRYLSNMTNPETRDQAFEIFSRINPELGKAYHELSKKRKKRPRE